VSDLASVACHLLGKLVASSPRLISVTFPSFKSLDNDRLRQNNPPFMCNHPSKWAKGRMIFHLQQICLTMIVFLT
jgi:hypothetical protein